MKLLSEYRQRDAARELVALGVPVLLVGFEGHARLAAAEYRTATRDSAPALPSLQEALLDPAACLAPLVKSERNPYQNFIFVGRASTCDVILRDASVSKSHAVFEREPHGAGWKLRDNRSHNGTWHNGRRLAPTARVALAHGDAVVFGAYPAYLVMPAELGRILGSTPP